MFETTNHLWWSYSDFMVISMFSGVFVVIYDYLLWFNVDFYADWVGFTRGNDDFGRCVYDVFYADWLGHFGMIPLVNHDSQWGRSGVVLIYPDLYTYMYI